MWRIYYDNGNVLENQDIPPSCRTGIISIAEQDFTHNWVFWYGKDWYLLETSGHWMGCDTAGFLDQMVHRCEHIKYVLQGRTLVPFQKYEEIINKMVSTCRPEKTGWHPGEKL